MFTAVFEITEWYGDDSPHLAVSRVRHSEQARLVKTVKVSITRGSTGPGSDRRLPPGSFISLTGSGDRYRLGHRPVGSQWQSDTHTKPLDVDPGGGAAALSSMYSQALVS